MYIDRLTLSNIASLKGEHTIDFKNVLARDGLFAITGPTGSGKSTLLSAISLALYGQGGKRSLSAKDYVSEGAVSGEVVLELRLEDKKYRAFWSCTVLKRDGTPRASPLIKSYIEDLATGEVMKASGAELTKLSLDQFNQCVILHQGEFANFLASTFAKRREILEGLVNIAQLDQVKESYQARKKALTREVELMEQRLSASELFSESEVSALETKKTQLEQLIKERAHILADFSALKMSFLKVREYFEIRDQTLTKKANFESELEKEITHYQADFAAFNQLESKQTTEEERWHAERSKISALIDVAAKLKLETNLWEKTRTDLARVTQEIAHVHQSVTNNETQIKALKFDYERQVLQQIYQERPHFEAGLEALEKLSDQQLSIQDEVKGLQDELSELEAKAKELKLKMAQSGLKDESYYETKRQELHEELRLKEKEHQELTTLLQLAERAQKDLTAQEKSIAEKREIFNQLPPQSELKRLIADQEALLMRERDLHSHLESILKLRELSLAAHQCELCHAPVHTLPEFEVLDAKDWQLKISEYEAAIVHWKEKLATSEQLEIALNSMLDKQSELKRELEALGREVQASGFTPEMARPLYPQLSAHLDELKQNLQLKREQELALGQELLALTRNTQQLQSYREDYQKKSRRLKEVAERLDALPAQILSEWNKISLLAPTLNETISRVEIRNLKNRLHHNCSRLEQKLLLERGLKEAYERRARLEGEQKQLVTEEEQKRAAIASLEATIPAEYRTLDLLAYLEQQDQIIQALKKSVREKERSLDEKKNQIARAKEALTHLNDNLKNARDSIERLRLELITKLESVKNHSDLPLPKDLAQRLELAPSEFLELSSSIMADIIDHAFTPWQSEIEGQDQQARSELAAITAKLQLQEKRVEAMKNMERELTVLKNKQHVLLTMQEFFGKNEFKNYVLAKLEDELVRMTNAELRKLCDGRYYLKSRATSNGPEFIVIDHWLSLSERKVASLSGGETFMVSLALSLGLAELSRGKTRIDSFFIDEGFGTLDPQTLESVTEVLLGLKGRGKVIGIISHVEALTTRLPRSLILHKSSGGESTITYQETLN